MDEPRFNVASMKLCTRALGPFKRMAIWFQGCDIGCPGCCNPKLQPLVPRNIIGLSELLEVASKSRDDNGIEGVTLIGGEPTLQSGLSELVHGIRALGLGVILFTGREFEDLDENLVSGLDLVIDGRYDNGNPDHSRNLVGSCNQRIVDVSGRYAGNDWFTVIRDDYIEMDVEGFEIHCSGSVF